MRLLTASEACFIIEDFCIHNNPLEADYNLNLIYQIAHSGAHKTCQKNHPEWTEEALKLLKRIK